MQKRIILIGKGAFLFYKYKLEVFYSILSGEERFSEKIILLAKGVGEWVDI